jgi:hypothetical protein
VERSKHRRGLTRALLGVLLAIGLGAVLHGRTVPQANATDTPILQNVKLGLGTMTRKERADLWRRLDEYATVDALQEFCGRKLNLQRRTWKVVSPCVETSSLRRVAAKFRAKKKKYIKAWKETHPDEKKRKELCKGVAKKLREYARIIAEHIAEADSMCRACIFC